MRLFLAGLSTAVLLSGSALAQDWAKARIKSSPRHIEEIDVKHGNRNVKSTIIFPEVKKKATAVIVIHEIFGLSDWVLSLTDQLAEEGYIAIAPDLLSGMGPDGGGTKELEKADGVRGAIRQLPPDQITADLNAVVEYVSKLDACNGKVVVCGFCWGGGQAFRFAANNDKIKAAFPFYGSAPTESDVIARVKCPVYGFYGENDARINAGIPKTKEMMKEAGKTYEPVIYEGAGHGFMRAGEQPGASEANKKGRADAWKRWKELLEKT